ncbi:MAG: PaaI family thioesterase, partial [Solirubrobacterales bacterium]
PATPYTTAELSMSFLRPAQLGATLSAGGQAIHVGRSVALSEAFLLEEGSDRLIAHGTSRCAVLPAIEPVPEPPDDLPVIEPDDDEESDPYRRPWPTDWVIPQDTWDSLSGREILERQLEGELPPPPIYGLTGMRPVEFDEGTATLRLPATGWLTSPATTVQGGVIAMLADTSMLIAVQTIAPPATAFAGLDLKVNYLRPVHPDGRDLTARAAVIHSGATIVIARAEVTNADGKLVAIATGSSMYLPGRPAALGELELAAEADEADEAAEAGQTQ